MPHNITLTFNHIQDVGLEGPSCENCGFPTTRLRLIYLLREWDQSLVAVLARR